MDHIIEILLILLVVIMAIVSSNFLTMNNIMKNASISKIAPRI